MSSKPLMSVVFSVYSDLLHHDTTETFLKIAFNTITTTTICKTKKSLKHYYNMNSRNYITYSAIKSRHFFFIKVSVPSQESERSWIYGLIKTPFRLKCGSVPTVWHLLFFIMGTDFPSKDNFPIFLDVV